MSRMITRFELKRTIYSSLLLMLVSIIATELIRRLVTEYSTNTSKVLIAISVAIPLCIALIFSMVFFGSIAEYYRREPGIITLALSYLPIICYMAAVKILNDLLMLEVFLLFSVITVLYVLVSEE